jgi:hypothetical protein
VPRARVSVGIVFLVLYVEFGKARVGNCAELFGRLCSWELCRVVGAMFGVALLGRCLELLLLFLVTGKCILVISSFVDPARIGLSGRCLELHSLICAFECLEMRSCNAELCRSCAHWELCRVVGARFGVAFLDLCI